MCLYCGIADTLTVAHRLNKHAQNHFFLSSPPAILVQVCEGLLKVDGVSDVTPCGVSNDYRRFERT